MEFTKYIACIYEGSAERAIIELLLNDNRLIFTWDDLLDGELIRCRSAKNFEEQYLRKGFTEKITVLRVLDSRKESFRLSKPYEHKIEVINIITAPEIEMLVILNEGKYSEYKKSGKKPSDFCRTDLQISKVKNYDFVKRYFSDVNALIAAILEYKRVSNIPKGEYALCDLLKQINYKRYLGNDVVVILYKKGRLGFSFDKTE